ncbi:acyl carrier protein [Apibacter raozihei]|uniref:acyl carrier protein n=1 Tax=Apibacter TaxID=1778601 RepID=UPI000FE32C27|nr:MULTISPECIES: acyl carrier protein [Apibacter]
MDSLNIQQQEEQVFEKLKQFITEVLGEDIADELDITPESIFTKDLEMDSIEIVALAEKVKQEYGDRMDFNEWLSGMDMEQLINLSIGDIVNLIVNAHS